MTLITHILEEDINTLCGVSGYVSNFGGVTDWSQTLWIVPEMPANWLLTIMLHNKKES